MLGNAKLGSWRWNSRFVSLNADIADVDVSTKPSNWTGADLKEIVLVKGARLSGKDLRNIRAGGAFLVKAFLEVFALTGFAVDFFATLGFSTFPAAAINFSIFFSSALISFCRDCRSFL